MKENTDTDNRNITYYRFWIFRVCHFDFWIVCSLDWRTSFTNNLRHSHRGCPSMSSASSSFSPSLFTRPIQLRVHTQPKKSIHALLLQRLRTRNRIIQYKIRWVFVCYFILGNVIYQSSLSISISWNVSQRMRYGTDRKVRPHSNRNDTSTSNNYGPKLSPRGAGTQQDWNAKNVDQSLCLIKVPTGTS